MEPEENTTFTLKWIVEDITKAMEIVKDNEEGPTTGYFALFTVGVTYWYIDLRPNPVDVPHSINHGMIWACVCLNRPTNELYPDRVCFDVSVTVHGRGDGPDRREERRVLTVPHSDQVFLNLFPMSDLDAFKQDGDQLHLTIEVRKLGPEAYTGLHAGYDDDENRNQLSIDMKKLLWEGYLSDFQMVAVDDGTVIPAHEFMLQARWLFIPGRLQNNRLYNISGNALRQFVEYLYTGVVLGSDENWEQLFEDVDQKLVGHSEYFYTPFSRMTCWTGVRKSLFNFTWVVEDRTETRVDIWRAFELKEHACLYLELRTVDDVAGEPNLEIRFAIPTQSDSDRVRLECSLSLFHNDEAFRRLSASQIVCGAEEWQFPECIPMDQLLVESCRLEFQLEVVYGADNYYKRETVTEFHTGNRGVNGTSRLATDLEHFFLEAVSWPHLFNATIRENRTEWYSSIKSFLGIRSTVFRELLQEQPGDGDVFFELEGNPQALRALSEYIYKGRIGFYEEVLAREVHELAKKFKLEYLECKTFEICNYHEMPNCFGRNRGITVEEHV